eukprot:941626_1
MQVTLILFVCSLAFRVSIGTACKDQKFMIPAYWHPSSTAWNVVLSSDPDKKWSGFIILNPCSGPIPNGCGSTEQQWQDKINSIKSQGNSVVGYVNSLYGNTWSPHNRDIPTVKALIDLYYSKYTGIDGIFIDETHYDAQYFHHYQQIYNHIKSKGSNQQVVLNVGSVPDISYANIADIIMVNENYYYYYNAFQPGWTATTTNVEIAHIIHGYDSNQINCRQLLHEIVEKSRCEYNVDYIYISNNDAYHMANSLPSDTYWTTEICEVKNTAHNCFTPSLSSGTNSISSCPGVTFDAWYDGSSYDSTSGVWEDKTSNCLNNIRVTKDLQKNIGSTYEYISGSSTSSFLIPVNIPNEYTLFHVCKYNGNNKRRIFNGRNVNWLSGFYGNGVVGYSGIAYHENWIPNRWPLPSISGNDWIISTDQRLQYRANGNLIGSVSNANSPGIIGVNHQYLWWGGDASDFACSEIIIVKSTLNAADIACVESYLQQKY